MRVRTDGHTHTHDTNWFYNLSHAICYSYGADKNIYVDFDNSLGLF